MPYIRIFDEGASESREFGRDEVRFGRDPASEFVPDGEACKVVSANHARAFFSENCWFIEDTGSRNGTYLDGARLTLGEPAQLAKGAKLRLGTTGPSFRIEAVSELRVSQTIDEPVPAVSPDDPTAPMKAIDLPTPPHDVSEPREPHIVLLHEASGTKYEATGRQFRLGRGRECEMRPVGPGDTSISRVHAQIEIKDDGSVIVRDAGSRNGTLVNGKLIDDELPVAVGDRLGLGATGPELLLEQLDGITVKEPPAPTPRIPSSEEAPPPRPTRRSPRRSFEGKGATVFFKDMFEESTRKSKSRLRWAVWAFVVLLAGSVGGMYWVSEMRVRGTEAQIAEQRRLLEDQRARADSLMSTARDEVDRLGQELERASAGAAPAAVLDSLRQALADAGARTDALEEALVTAQQSLSRELAMGDSLRRQAQAELARVRAELGRAQGGGQPTARMDSLLDALRAAEERADAIEAQMRAIRGVDLASISQASQGAIGLVTVFSPSGIYDGSGFMITPSGYFITNRHVVLPDGASADSIFVTMADQSRPHRATLANVAEQHGPDLAVLSVSRYSGPHLRQIDWTGTRMRQGEPAALIGFPAGMVAAMDASQTGTVKTSMSAGIFSKVEAERVQFDGFTVSGSSGSPIFNASGEVVAVHRSGLKEAAGLGFGVPINKLIVLLPGQTRAELGIR
jgi:pSer/pThr/pTyr-binding forkhead associated (FHA) protein/S1-C subfamily serine protease